MVNGRNRDRRSPTTLNQGKWVQSFEQKKTAKAYAKLQTYCNSHAMLESSIRYANGLCTTWFAHEFAPLDEAIKKHWIWFEWNLCIAKRNSAKNRRSSSHCTTMTCFGLNEIDFLFQKKIHKHKLKIHECKRGSPIDMSRLEVFSNSISNEMTFSDRTALE